MRAGLPKYVPINLRDIEVAGFKEGEEVSLESLKAKGIINPSGRERRLPLKVRVFSMLKAEESVLFLSFPIDGLNEVLLPSHDFPQV